MPTGHHHSYSLLLVRKKLKSPPITALAASIALVAVLLAPVASAQTSGDIAARDQLIANQENLLNTYRCLFGVDTDVVPGGCPTPDRIEPGPAPANPTQNDIDVRDGLIQNQEALLNVYRCQFDVDTQLVPGGCVDTTPSSEPTPGVQPTPVVTPEPTSEPLRLLTVEEIRAVAPNFGPNPPAYVPSKGDVQAELKACMDLGADAIQFISIESTEKMLALCSNMYRAAAYAIDYGFVEPSCAHEWFRDWMLREEKGGRRVGWADNCYSPLDPNPDRNWFQRCITLAEMVSPPVAQIGNTQPHILGRLCRAPTEEQIGRLGRCIELYHLYGSGIGMGALARQPENQWEVLLDLRPIPQRHTFLVLANSSQNVVTRRAISPYWVICLDSKEARKSSVLAWNVPV